MVFVRSARSFLPKNEKGIFLSFSARVLRRTPLSMYVERNVALYWNTAETAINRSTTIIAAINMPNFSLGRSPSRRYSESL